MAPWTHAEIDDDGHFSTIEFLPLQEEAVIHRRLLQSTAGTYVRPIVQSISNSGKLVIKLNEAVEFPDDIVD